MPRCEIIKMMNKLSFFIFIIYTYLSQKKCLQPPMSTLKHIPTFIFLYKINFSILFKGKLHFLTKSINIYFHNFILSNLYLQWCVFNTNN